MSLKQIGYNMISCHVITINISEWATTWYWSVQCWYTGLQMFKGLQTLSCPPSTTSWCSSVIISTKHTCLLPPLPDYMLYLMKPYVYICFNVCRKVNNLKYSVLTYLPPSALHLHPDQRPNSTCADLIYFYRYLLIKKNPAKSYNKRLNAQLF